MKIYKKYLQLCCLFSVVLIFAYFTAAYYFFKMPHTALPYRMYLDMKEEIAKASNGPKIILTSGSATNYGIRASDIQEELGVTAINLSVNAGIQLDYILYRAKKVIKGGDIVILPLEYNHFAFQRKYSLARSLFLRTYDREFFNTLSYEEQILNIVNTTPEYFLKGLTEQTINIDTYVESINQHLKKFSTKSGDSLYELPKEKNLINKVKPFDLSRIKSGGSFEETTGLKILKEFNFWCKQNNVTLYVTYANIIHFKEFDTELYRQYFLYLEDYFKKNNIKTIGVPSDFFYEHDMFADTEYHLTQESIKLRTKQFIKKMKKMNIINK